MREYFYRFSCLSSLGNILLRNRKKKQGSHYSVGSQGRPRGQERKGSDPNCRHAWEAGRPGGREAGRGGPPHFQMEPAVYSDPVLHELHRHLEFLNSGLCGDFLVSLYPSSQPVTTPWLSPEAWHWENPGLGNQSSTSPAQVVQGVNRRKKNQI